jgi:hypothetical protein
LSTLTKVLIVLLSVFSLFLCGIVATYVATAENYHKTANDNQTRLSAATKARESAEKREEDTKKACDTQVAEMGKEKDRVAQELIAVKGELDNLKRTKDQLDKEHVGMMATVQTVTTGEQQQRTLYAEAQKKLQTLEAEKTDREKELTETSQALVEKMATIAQLQDSIRQLTQENQELGIRINQYLVKFGKIPAQPPTTVAAGDNTVRPAQPVVPISSTQTRGIGLTGQVTQTDLRSHLVEISIGAAAGVQKDMTFHVIRGDRFVADVLIMEVWPDKAIGVLNIVQTGMQPQAGDKATTNL